MKVLKLIILNNKQHKTKNKRIMQNKENKKTLDKLTKIQRGPNGKKLEICMEH